MNIYTEYSLYIVYICIHFILVGQLNYLKNILTIKYN